MDAEILDASIAGATRTHDAAPMRLYVCTTCRDPLAPVGAARPGARLHAALVAAVDDPAVEIVPVECLSVCKRSCTVAFAAPGKWTYVFGDLPANTGLDILLTGARLYAEAKDGIIPWKLRPDALKKGVVSRTPPLPRETA